MEGMMACMYADAVELIKKKAGEMKLDQVELADKANISPSQVSRIFSLKSTASSENLVNLAIAVQLPPNHILEIAGRLPKQPETDPLTEEGIYILKQLEGNNKEDAVRYLRMRMEVAEKQGKYDAPKRKERPSKVG
jgi:transcriptional regulator with XRE-family HTH domain